MTRRVALYLRISLDKTGEAVGVARQEHDLRAYATQQGWTVTAVYTDNSISATTGTRRPEFERLLQDARNYDAILCYAIDRLYRQISDLERIVTALGDTPVIALLGGDVDLSTPDGRLIARILGSVAQAETDKKSRRQRDANKARARLGVPSMAAPGFGFITSPDGGIMPDPETAPIVESLYTRFLEGETLSSLADWLNENGVKGARGGNWTQGAVGRMLRRPENGGTATYLGEPVGKLAHGGIVDASTWRRANAILTDPRRNPRRKGAGRPAGSSLSLSGVLRCAKCGGPVRASSNSTKEGRYLTFSCEPNRHVSWRRETLTQAVEHQVVERLRQALPYLRAAEQRRQTIDGDPASALAEIDRLRTDMGALAQSLANGVITGAAFKQASDTIAEKIKRLEFEVDAMATPMFADGGLLAGDNIDEVWEQLPSTGRQQIIRLIVDHVVVGPASKGEFEIVWKK